MKTQRFLLVLSLLCLFQAPAAFSQAQDKPMTDRELSKFIADWPAAVKWLDDKNQKFSASPNGDVPAAFFLNKDFKAFIGKRGWTDERFFYVVGSVYSLMGVATLERKNPEIAKQFDEAIAQIEASELPPGEKASNIKSINEAKNSMLALSSDKAYNQDELKLVRARYDELAKILGIEKEE